MTFARREKLLGCGPVTGLLLLFFLPSRAQAQDTTLVRLANDSVMIRFADADLRAVVQALAPYLPKPVLVGLIEQRRVTMESPGPVPRSAVRELLKGLVESQNLVFVEDSTFFRIVSRVAEPAGARPVAGPLAPPQLFVIRLRHAHGSDVAATVNQLFGGGGAFSGRPGLSGGTLSDELRRIAPAPAEGVPPPTQRGPGATLAGPVTIVADDGTNSLLIRASPEDFEVIRQAVEQIDIRPLQVLIEVLIVEARRDRRFSLGVDLQLPPQDIGGDATLQGTLTGGGLGDLVLRIMNLGRFDLDGVLRLAQAKGDVRIVSRPVLLASNNTEARFLVGSQRPFVQVSRSLPTDTPTRDQVVQYRDVGTKLTVLPTINVDGYVSLLIQQEVNAATNETQFDAPVISTREASTRLLVKDGQTIVLGGLRDQQKDNTKSGIPILSSLPLVGGLFGASDQRTTETELFLFITPRILRTDEDVNHATKAAQDSAARTGVRMNRPPRN